MTHQISDHVIDTARSTDLVRLAERYGVMLRKESAASWCGPCPACGGGEDRFWIRDNRYKCRVCGATGDAIAFVQLRERCDFPEAVARLTGHATNGTPAKPLNIPAAPPPQPKRTGPDAKWTAKATEIADEAATSLFTDPYAEAGREYLLQRGIEPLAWAEFKLGYRPDVPLPGTWDTEKREYIAGRKPAIVIPWYRGGQVAAIRYRFLETHTYGNAQDKLTEAKQTAQPGSTFAGLLYGGHALPSYTPLPTAHSDEKRAENYRTLVICEGELNAISIWQVTEPWRWDVLSLGSESAKLSQAAIDYARQFGRVLVWMDRAPVARDLVALLMPLAFGVNSPAREGGGKLDANDLLQLGKLGEFLATVRMRACKSQEERMGFYCDLMDASNGLAGLGEGILRIAKGLKNG